VARRECQSSTGVPAPLIGRLGYAGSSGYAGSLRQAINDINAAGAGPHTINLAAGQTYSIDQCGAADNGGLLINNGPLTIRGNGSTIAMTCAGARVFRYNKTSLLTINDAVKLHGTGSVVPSVAERRGRELLDEQGTGARPWLVQSARAGARTGTRSVLQHAAGGVGRPLDCLDDLEGIQPARVSDEHVAAGGSRLGSHPAASDERCHRLRQESRRGAEPLGQFGCLQLDPLVGQDTETTECQVGSAGHFQSHGMTLRARAQLGDA
jgi:hypothetical protein